MRLALFAVLLLLSAPPSEREKHQGTWSVVSFVREGKATSREIVDSIERIVEGDHVVWKRNGKSFAGTTMKLDPATVPASIDLIPDGGPDREKIVRGIYKIEGDILTLCTSDPDKSRPQGFKAGAGSGQTLMTFRRARAGK